MCSAGAAGGAALRPPAPARCAGALLAIEHIGARDLVVLAAHQRQFDLILHVLDVEGAACARRGASARLTTSPVSCFDDVMDAARGRRACCPRRRGTPWSSRPRSLLASNGVTVPLRRMTCIARAPCGEQFTGTATARMRRLMPSGSSFEQHRDIGIHPEMLWGQGPSGRCRMSRSGERRHGLQATAGTPRPWTFLVSRQVSWLAGRQLSSGLPEAWRPQ